MVVGGDSDQRVGCHPNRRPFLGERYSRILPGCGSSLSKAAELQKVALSFSLSSPKGGEGGERRPFPSSFPSLQLSPHSFLAGREGKTPSAFFIPNTIGRLSTGWVSPGGYPIT